METPPLYGDKDVKAINKLATAIASKTDINYKDAEVIAEWEIKNKKVFINALSNTVISDPLMVRRFYQDIAKKIEEQYEINILSTIIRWLPCLVKSVVMYILKMDYRCHEEWIAMSAHCSRTTVISACKRVDNVLLYDIDDRSAHLRYWYKIITMIAENLEWRYVHEQCRAEAIPKDT